MLMTKSSGFEVTFLLPRNSTGRQGRQKPGPGTRQSCTTLNSTRGLDGGRSMCRCRGIV